MSDPVALTARGLTVRVGGRALLSGVDLTVRRGEVLLLAGPSGAGKSVLLHLIGGLAGPRTPGMQVEGSLVVSGRAGLVFQDFALFTGMTVEENIAFAQDHRRPKPEAETARRLRRELTEELDLDPGARIATLSGGQKQRAAIARALAFHPEILAYDEPTSGLDPALGDRVARLIRETNRRHETTSIIVTHDLPGLIDIADRVLLLDPRTQGLEEVTRQNAPARLAAAGTPPPAPPPKRTPVAVRLLAGLAAFFEGSCRAAEGLLAALLHLLPRWRSPRWGLRYFRHFLRTVAGPGSLLYFLLAGTVIGLISTYFVFTFLPYRRYTEGLVLDDIIAGLGFGLHRILVPLIVTVLLAARAGAAVSADVATRVAGQEDSAMRSLGAKPSRYLLTGTLWAFLLGAPVASALAFLGSAAASAAVFAVMAPDVSLHAFSDMFHRLLTEPGSLLPAGSDWVAGKVLSSAFGIGAIAYFLGARPKESPGDVAGAITSTVIRGTVLVLAIHLAFALVEF